MGPGPGDEGKQAYLREALCPALRDRGSDACGYGRALREFWGQEECSEPLHRELRQLVGTLYMSVQCRMP